MSDMHSESLQYEKARELAYGGTGLMLMSSLILIGGAETQSLPVVGAGVLVAAGGLALVGVGLHNKNKLESYEGEMDSRVDESESIS